MSWQQTYPRLSGALAPEYRALPRDQVEQVVRGVFGEGTELEDVEGFFDDVGKALSNVASQAAPVVGKALPGALSGALAGAPLGLPGIIGGALLGGVGGALGGGGHAPGPPTAPIGPPPAGVPTAPGAGAGIAGALPGLIAGGGVGPSTAVAQLLGALGSPTTQQALLSMLLGNAGGRTASTATGSQVPVAAITNLLGMLANRASAEWESVAPYGAGDFISEGLDAANPEVRAGWLYAQLAPLEWAAPTQASAAVRSAETDEAWLDEMYDEAEAEFYAELDTESP
jgi:hypothetical protein